MFRTRIRTWPAGAATHVPYYHLSNLAARRISSNTFYIMLCVYQKSGSRSASYGAPRWYCTIRNPHRLEMLVYIRSLYQCLKAWPRCTLWGTTSPQHQCDRRADTVTMVQISAKIRTSFTLTQLNIIGWLVCQLTLAFHEEQLCCHRQGL